MKLLLGCIAGLALVLLVAYRAGVSKANCDAFEESVSRLTPEQKTRVARLVATETAGMTRNEEKAIVYYQSPERTGRLSRIYLLWHVFEPGSATYRALRAQVREKEKATEGTDLAMIAYLDLWFYEFRTRHHMMLGSLFEAWGLSGIRGLCYRWEPEMSSWDRIGNLSNDAVLGILRPDQKRAIREGTYNVVYVGGTRRSRN